LQFPQKSLNLYHKSLDDDYSKKVIVAQPNENWQIIDWHKEIEILDGVYCCIGQYLKEHGSPYA
jgi:hypothetical protein